jgi:hypothetical protein
MQPEIPLNDLNDDGEASQLSDFYVEGGLLVYTAAYHIKRGVCCGSGCRHCPYEPKHVAGNTVVERVESGSDSSP